MTLSLPGAFARRLSKHLIGVRTDLFESLQPRNGPRETDTGLFAPIPDAPELRDLLNVAFFASVQREEGRDVAFALEWAPPAKSLFLPFDARLASPVPLDPQTLAKLSPAIRTPVSLAVTGPPLQGWAMVRQEDFPALNFHILVRRPGALFVSYAYETHFIYDSGIGVITGFEDEPGEDHYARAMLEGALVDEEAFPAKSKVDAIFDIAIECIREGHGATLIVLPRAVAPVRVVTRSHWVSPSKYSTTLSGALRSLREPGPTKPQDWDLYRQTVRAVARLASIDGAVLLDPELNVIGFGAILACAPYAGQVNPPDRPRGARHNAAINFVGEIESAAAVVISQDSRVTAITRSGSAVNCTRATDLRRSSDLYGQFAPLD